MRQRSPGHHQELEHVVEDGGVAAAFAHDRQNFLQVVADEVRLAHRLARAHPVDVAPQRVDFTVVRDVAVRMRQRPRRERIRAEPLVHQRQCRLHARIHQIGEHRLDLIGNQHAFIDERVRRQTRDVEIFFLGRRDRQLVDRVLDALADDVQLPLERRADGKTGPGALFAVVCRKGLPDPFFRAHQWCRAADENLLEVRLHRGGGGAHQAIVGRQVAPAEQALPLFVDDLFDERFDRGARRRVARQKHGADAVFALRRQRDAQPRGFLAQELVGNLNQDAGAVAGVHFAAARPAVQQVDENLQRLADDAVRPHALDVDDEADAAGVVLEGGVIQALGRGTLVMIHKKE